MQRQQSNQQSSDNNSDDLIAFLNSTHQNSNNSVDCNSFFNNNHQYSNNRYDDLASFLNNQQNGYQSSSYHNLASETLLQNLAIDLNRLSINGGASTSNHSQCFTNNFSIESAYPPVLPNQPASLSTIGSNLNNIVAGANPQLSINGGASSSNHSQRFTNNFSLESAYPPVLPNQPASLSAIGSNLNNIVTRANPQLSINGGASSSNGNNFFLESTLPPAVPNLRNRQPITRRSTGFQRNLIPGLDMISRSELNVWECNHLQRNLEEGDSETRNWIITKVTPDLPLLMMHQNGSAFAQAMFKSCDEQQINKILHSVVLVNESLFVTICNDYCGRESAKALIENLKTEEQMSIIVYVMRDRICSFTNSLNAKQVLEFFIKASTNFCRQILFNEMASHCVAIGTDRVGCYALQDCICTEYIESNLVPYLLHSIVLNSPYLSEDIHGNYVVQCAITSGIGCVKRGIVERLQGRFKELSKSKAGSNVVEKCLRTCEDTEVEKIVEELMNPIVLPSVVQDAFGNFVAQTALEQLHHRGIMNLYRTLVKRISDHSLILSNHLYGRKVFYKIRELSQKMNHQRNSTSS